MRWFVEVSRVGETSSDEKYCVEAKQWQAALQEARKLRGDSGPLSKFSIELLDDGYRAVDPKQKLRYVVAKAPQDAVLSSVPPESAFRPEAARLNGQPAPSVAPSAAPPAPAPAAPVAAAPAAPVAVAPAAPVAVAAPAPAAPAAALAQAQPAPNVAAAAPGAAFPAHAEPYAGVPSSALSPHAPDSAVRSTAEAAAPAPAAAPAANKTPSAFPPRPGGSVRPPSMKPTPGIMVPADAIPPAPGVPKGLGAMLPPQNMTQPSPAIDMPPPASVFRKRHEEPNAESPITYREVAYVVEPGVSRGSVEALLWASFRDLSRELAERPGQKFVQLAVFDHKFDKRPQRAPLGTLAWKDWRGNPVLTFPFFDGTTSRKSSMPPAAVVPVAVVQVSSSAPPAPQVTAPAAAAPVAFASATSTPVMPLVIPGSGSAPPPASDVIRPAAVMPVAVQSDPEGSAIPLTREKSPSQPASARTSKPRLATLRRRVGEDLIGELFETMHDLHFMSGVADGAEFVLAALDSIVPCDGVLIHVFDINTRQFVVVRAKGPGAIQVIMHRTPDSDEFFSNIMRRPGSVAIHDTAKDARVLGTRWDSLGVKPTRALCGPVRQGGRYLGLVEVCNPLGDAPFHQTEQNAIDYVCEQFAQFLADRPIVLDAEVILRR